MTGLHLKEGRDGVDGCCKWDGVGIELPGPFLPHSPLPDGIAGIDSGCCFPDGVEHPGLERLKPRLKFRGGIWICTDGQMSGFSHDITTAYSLWYSAAAHGDSMKFLESCRVIYA